MPPHLSLAARELLSAQRGLIADWQAPAAGLTAQRMRRACHSGWARVSQHVFSDRTGEIDIAQRRTAAVLECGPGAALTARAALREAGWRADDEPVVDVLVTRGFRRRGEMPAWIRLRYTIDPGRVSGQPPRAATARAAVDAATRAGSSDEVLFLMASAVQQRLTTPGRLAAELRRRPLLRHQAAMRAALDEIVGGAQSANEAAFLRECRRRGLPKPRMQVRRVDAEASTRYTDAEFRLPGGRLLIVEIEGAGHFDIGSWRADLARHNGLAAVTGAMILHVTGWEIRHDPDPFFDLLASLVLGRVLSNRGA